MKDERINDDVIIRITLFSAIAAEGRREQALDSAAASRHSALPRWLAWQGSRAPSNDSVSDGLGLLSGATEF